MKERDIFFFGGGGVKNTLNPPTYFHVVKTPPIPSIYDPGYNLRVVALSSGYNGDATAIRRQRDFHAPSGNCSEVVRWSCASRNRVAVVKRRIRAAGQTLSVYTQVDRLYRCQQLASRKLRQSTCVPLHSGDGSRGGCRRQDTIESRRVASRYSLTPSGL